MFLVSKAVVTLKWTLMLFMRMEKNEQKKYQNWNDFFPEKIYVKKYEKVSQVRHFLTMTSFAVMGP